MKEVLVETSGFRS